MPNQLTGMNIVVTGASRGIGASIARVLAEAGAKVAITYSSQEAAAQAVLAALPGEGHTCVQMNLSEETSITSAFENIYKSMGSIHGLVNNAGLTKDQLLLRMKVEDFDHVINANLRGSFIATKCVLKEMVRQRSGSIVNIVSIIGETGNAGQANYAASKAGLIAFAKSVAKEVASRGIRVNNVAPGFIETEMTQVLSEEVKTKMLEKVPLAKIGHSDDVAKAVKFLLSSDASYITGHTLDVNGGMYMN